MPHNNFLHHHKDFSELIRIVARDMGVDPSLVEKDYWIMHCLFGLQQQGYDFHLKGGTSLSKGFGVIHRFSEDIDIRIEPPSDMEVKTGKNHTKGIHRESRKEFYDWLAQSLQIDGVSEIVRDPEFDDLPQYRSGGIRLKYNSPFSTVVGLKDGILLELGFDDVTPAIAVDISSWAYDRAIESGVEIEDNRATQIQCYHPGYTFVEKLQTISTKYRNQQKNGTMPTNFIRHYYDIYQLLQNKTVNDFIGTDEYKEHKAKRFPNADNQDIAQNEAFALNDPAVRAQYAGEYSRTSSLYYQGQPGFNQIMNAIEKRKAGL